MTGDELFATDPASIDGPRLVQPAPPAPQDVVAPAMPLADGESAARAVAELALARSEARFRALVDATEGFVWERTGAVAFDHAAGVWWEQLTGQPAAAANAHGGWGWLDCVHPEDRVGARDAWSHALATRTRFERQYRVRAADGGYRYVAVRGGPVGDDPSVDAWLGTFTDVTAREDANRVKSEFLAVMSHELRTPLNAIGGYVDLLELGVHGPVTPEQLADLARVRVAQRTLLRHVNDVLNFAKLEAGQVEFDLQSVPVAALLATVEPLVAPQLAARELAYECLPADPGLRVRADLEKATQVLLNLVANAIKFTDAGGRVTVGAHADGDDRVVVSVTDTGVGIAAAHLPRVFEPFVQVDARLTRQRQGTGLGLSISRDLVRGMGGELSAESAVGVGSTFRVTLPRAE